MSDSVYKLVELTGSSTTTIESRQVYGPKR